MCCRRIVTEHASGTLIAMATSFYFYDLETSGFNPREARIMQFAGQRTDMDLNPIGEPHNVLIKLSDDVVPDPDAVLITGITPQQTLANGMTEAEFLHIFEAEISIPGTIFTGYNTVRFDDEFMRYLHYRNLYDPYEWQWQDKRSRWDLLDMVRMTRALRPDGIQWPTNPDGSPTNRLELLTAANGLDHAHAHDALNDVLATIAIARLIRSKQGKLFDYLLKMRLKQEVKTLVGGGKPFVYSSGKYSAEFQKTTIATYLCDHPKKQGVLVYDLRHDPTRYIGMSPEQLVQAWQYQPKPDPDNPRLPVKLLQYNRCPAVAPVGVLDADAQQRLGIDLASIQANAKKLQAAQDFCPALERAIQILDTQQQARFAHDALEVDAQLYEGFFADADKTKMRVVRAADWRDVPGIDVVFKDARLQGLLPLYKARNFRQFLTDDERVQWERYRERKLLGGKQSSRLAKFFNRLGELAAQPDITPEKQYLLEELQLYGQSIMPVIEE